ncbi:MAG: hypothetical protein HUJ26_04670 [Planctomycetaceae bacterium]|nr:hypothetical protein [Planctomycetaceae bacterium]
MSLKHQTAQKFCLLILALVPCLLLTGCNYGVILGYMIGGPPSIEPDFAAQTGKDMKDYGVTVAVVCTAPPSLKWSYDEIDNLVAEAITMQLAQKKIKVIYPDQVRAWLDKNPDWASASEIGEYFDVTYVIHVDMTDYSLYEQNSHTLYRGNSRCEVNVWDMAADDEAEIIYSKEISSKYPLTVPRSSQESSLEQFKKEYLFRLSYDIGKHFFEYYASDDISDRT